MNMILSEPVMRRLAFVRYLYKVAVVQSQQPEPLNAVSVLTFHDSIELFLQLASQQYNLKTDDIKFMQYWEVLSKKMAQELGYKESIRRLRAYP